MVKITGVMPLRNAVRLAYPFQLAIRSLRSLCDEVIVLVDPLGEDDTMARVRAMAFPRAQGGEGFVDTIIESEWDMGNHRGHVNCEISVQTAKACAAASGDWIMSLQADELIHEADVPGIRQAVERADAEGVTGLELRRLYFYGGLDRYRADWTLWLARLFKRGAWRPDIDGAMRFDPIDPAAKRCQILAHIYHYSRVGDPQVIAERVRNLDGFFHTPDAIQSGRIAPYNFARLRKLDTYVKDAPIEDATGASLIEFDPSGHPAGVMEYFNGR